MWPPASVFEVRCAPCHGLFGEGGRGPTLARPRLVRAPDDASLYKVIRGGIPQTEMPGAAGMDEAQIREVAAYVRTLGTHGVETVPGDPAAGERLYRTKGGCGVCHMVGTEGGVIGPPLGEVGARRSAAYLRAVLLDPASKLPEGFLQISVVTRDGQRLAGIRVNEDTLLDSDARPVWLFPFFLEERPERVESLCQKHSHAELQERVFPAPTDRRRCLSQFPAG